MDLQKEIPIAPTEKKKRLHNSLQITKMKLVQWILYDTYGIVYVPVNFTFN